jgi:membrane AbrB-like protein
MRETLRGLTIGAAGGALCALLHVPAPWLAGSMTAAVVAAFLGYRIGMPDWLRNLAFILLGVQTGTSVTWDTVDRAAHWPLSLALLAVTVVAITWSGHRFYVRRGWDARTALFASLPGALSLVLLLASETRADLRRVAIAQCIRLFFLIAALPALIELLSPAQPLSAHSPVISSLPGLALLLALAAAAGLGLEKLKVPAGLILGPVVVAAAGELTGLLSGTAPGSVLIPANVVLGVMIASRFNDFSFAEFRQALGEGFSGFLIALAIAAAGAGLATAVAGLPFALTLLAFAPGGLDAMTLMAFALGLDPAYVGAHQIARYVGMVLLMPAVTGWLVRRIGSGGEVRQ